MGAEALDVLGTFQTLYGSNISGRHIPALSAWPDTGRKPRNSLSDDRVAAVLVEADDVQPDSLVERHRLS
jgi:hypothetical protein